MKKKIPYLCIETMRWYGPDDPVTLANIRQAGCEGVITALHHIPNGEVWSINEINKRKLQIEAVGLKWSGVESLPVHEYIKTQTGDYQKYVENYKTSIRNLSACGIKMITYNFMPILDWTRTNLKQSAEDKSLAMAFDPIDLAVFDLYILKRSDAKKDYTEEDILLAQRRFEQSTTASLEQLKQNILAGLPGAEEHYTMSQLQNELNRYKGYDAEKLRSNLVAFLKQIIPVCDEVGVVMAIHPDDPPRDILGLHRIMSTASDYRKIIKAVPSHANGLCLCTGSFGSSANNNIEEMIREFAPYLQFLHLRSTKRDEVGGFVEANHLEGSLDMYAIMRAVVEVSHQMKHGIILRPDHGHLMDAELRRDANPGYSFVGRMRGLAELRGLELGIARTLYENE